jgi:hypothetical protein
MTWRAVFTSSSVSVSGGVNSMTLFQLAFSAKF